MKNLEFSRDYVKRGDKVEYTYSPDTNSFTQEHMMATLPMFPPGPAAEKDYIVYGTDGLKKRVVCAMSVELPRRDRHSILYWLDRPRKIR